MQVVLASSNVGKLKEFKAILEPFGIEILTLKDIGFTDEIEENGNTFMENALLKAKAVYNFCKHPVIADDSGLCVDALNGAPGIYSARFGGCHSDKERREYLLNTLQNETNRKAHFHCSIIFLIDETHYKHFEGNIEGYIAETETGTNGFGYDALFHPTLDGPSMAELSCAEKNKISHRGLALNKFEEYMKNDFNY